MGKLKFLNFCLGVLSLVMLGLGVIIYYLALSRQPSPQIELAEESPSLFRTDSRSLAQGVIILNSRKAFTPQRKSKLLKLFLKLKLIYAREEEFKVLALQLLKPAQKKWLQAYLTTSRVWLQPASITHPLELLGAELQGVPALPYQEPRQIFKVEQLALEELALGLLALKHAPPSLRLTRQQLGCLKAYLLKALPDFQAQAPTQEAVVQALTQEERIYLKFKQAHFNPRSYSYPYCLATQDPDIELVISLLRQP
jgi:hypothetical protein